MSDSHAMLVEMADRLFADLAADTKADFAALWGPVAENGLPTLLVPEDHAGFGGDWLDAVAVLRLAGYHALPLPLAEAIVAAQLVAAMGLEPARGLTVFAPVSEGTVAGGRFTGRLKSVPWGRDAEIVVGATGGTLVRLRRADAAETVQSQNPVGEPRDTLVFTDAPAEIAASDANLFALGALTRAAQIAGALDGALARSIQYANDRVQFGKPIGKFQAVQQALAVFAEEAAAVNCAAQAAARAADAAHADGGDAAFEIAAAKLRANIAAQVGHSTAHQVHGAIGFTWEYDLHRWTRRLISWASECGSERYWAEWLGGQVAARGADALWPDMTARG
jgi:acyl-CoA dehydrogenase